MKNRLLWKLLAYNTLPVIAVIVLVVWFAVDKLAANYFMALMKTYEISPDDIHRMFVSSVHFYLIWASAGAVAVAIFLSYLLTRKLLRPLSQITAITGEIASGNFELRADVKTSDEVGQLGRAFNDMADRLERVENLRKAMVADVAHELRTPLTNLRGYLEALNDEVIPPSKETLAMLQAENLRLVSLVDNLQKLARAEAANSYLKKEELDLRELIPRILDLHKLNFEKKRIHVNTFWHTDEVRLLADRDKLLQAMLNLVDNCCRYTPEEGEVEVHVGRDDTGIYVTFRNSGETIDKEHLPFLFERFYRLDRSRSRERGGAGIGLAITKEIIKAHGGTVTAESENATTSITITLPASF